VTRRPRAPAGAEVSLYVDSIASVEPGDAIVTGTGRAYMVTAVRVQARGKHRGRQHLRAIVSDVADIGPGIRRHKIYWYRRKKRTP
jgi:hypothetical protein